MDRREACLTLVAALPVGAKILEKGPFKRQPSKLRFRIAMRRSLRKLYRSGVITRQEFEQYMRVIESQTRVLGDETSMDVLYDHCCGLMVQRAMDWDQIVQWWNSLIEWITENWVEIAKLLASLVVIVL